MRFRGLILIAIVFSVLVLPSVVAINDFSHGEMITLQHEDGKYLSINDESNIDAGLNANIDTPGESEKLQLRLKVGGGELWTEDTVSFVSFVPSAGGESLKAKKPAFTNWIFAGPSKGMIPDPQVNAQVFKTDGTKGKVLCGDRVYFKIGEEYLDILFDSGQNKAHLGGTAENFIIRYGDGLCPTVTPTVDADNPFAHYDTISLLHSSRKYLSVNNDADGSMENGVNANKDSVEGSREKFSLRNNDKPTLSDGDEISFASISPLVESFKYIIPSGSNWIYAGPSDGGPFADPQLDVKIYKYDDSISRSEIICGDEVYFKETETGDYVDINGDKTANPAHLGGLNRFTIFDSDGGCPTAIVPQVEALENLPICPAEIIQCCRIIDDSIPTYTVQSNLVMGADNKQHACLYVDGVTGINIIGEEYNITNAAKTYKGIYLKSAGGTQVYNLHVKKFEYGIFVENGIYASSRSTAIKDCSASGSTNGLKLVGSATERVEIWDSVFNHNDYGMILFGTDLGVKDNEACSNGALDVLVTGGFVPPSGIIISTITGIGNKFGTTSNPNGPWPATPRDYSECPGGTLPPTGCGLHERLCIVGGVEVCADPADCETEITCNNNRVCDTGESCTCEDCHGAQDSCGVPLICEPNIETCEACPFLTVFNPILGVCEDGTGDCPIGTTPCNDGVCRTNCGGETPNCKADGVCDLNEALVPVQEGCECADCIDSPVPCANDGICLEDTDVCGCPDGTTFNPSTGICEIETVVHNVEAFWAATSDGVAITEKDLSFEQTVYMRATDLSAHNGNVATFQVFKQGATGTEIGEEMTAIIADGMVSKALVVNQEFYELTKNIPEVGNPEIYFKVVYTLAGNEKQSALLDLLNHPNAFDSCRNYDLSNEGTQAMCEACVTNGVHANNSVEIQGLLNVPVFGTNAQCGGINFGVTDNDAKIPGECGDYIECKCIFNSSSDCIGDAQTVRGGDCNDPSGCTGAGCNPHDITAGTCKISMSNTDGDCSTNSVVSYSWTGAWTWNLLNSFADSDLTEAERISGNYRSYLIDTDTFWRYDPKMNNGLKTMSELCGAGGTNQIICPANIQLPFFGGFSLIASLMILSLIYLAMNCKIKRRE